MGNSHGPCYRAIAMAAAETAGSRGEQDALLLNVEARDGPSRPIETELDPESKELSIPVPTDLLPSMVDVMWKLVELKKEDPTLFMVRGESVRDQNLNVEEDQAMIERVMMECIEGKTYWESMKLFWFRFQRKEKLIK